MARLRKERGECRPTLVIERTMDWGWVKRFLEKEEVRDAAGANWTEEQIEFFWGLLANPAHWVIRAEQGGLEGIFMFIRCGDGSFEVHACTARKNWGLRWVGLAYAVAKWFRGQVPEARVHTKVRDNVQEYELFVRFCGMRQTGAVAAEGLKLFALEGVN